MSQMYCLTCFAAPKSWNEDRTKTNVPRVTPAEVSLALSPPPNASSKYESTLDATTASSYQMTYLPNGNASFVFTEIITATDFLGKEGSFITQGKGTFTAATFAVEGTFEIVKETGMGALKGVEGKGSFGPAGDGSHKLKYVFEIKGVEMT